MALDDTDRRRFRIAAIFTILALPVLWWSNREDSAAPNVATAGVEISGQADTTDGPGPATTADGSNLIADSIPTDPPVFMDGPVPNVASVSEIAVPDGATDSILTEATFRRSINDPTTCLSRTFQPGTIVTIVNLDNNRTTTCRIGLAPSTQTADLVMHTDRFLELADLTDAPIPVEIRP